MKSKVKKYTLSFFAALLLIYSCKGPQQVFRSEKRNLPASYNVSTDTTNVANLSWKEFFTDSNLVSLIDSALKNNQELNIVLQEIEIAKNEVKTRKGEYLPFVNLGIGGGMDKPGKYTRMGALEDQLEIQPGKNFPEPMTDLTIGLNAIWEIDIWKKLVNAKNAAKMRLLATNEGKNFMVTKLVSEIAENYYELMAYDNILDMLEKNIEIQSAALQVIKQEKDAAKVSQLAVNRFEAQLLNTTNLQYEVKQRIIETENRLHFLTGSITGPIARNSQRFLSQVADSVSYGVPAQLLYNRPDIRQAEYELAASKLDVKVARANFYPSLRLQAGFGVQAFNPSVLFRPESILYSLLGDLFMPLLNRNAIQAAYNTSKSKQIQAVYNYEQTVLKAYLDVLNHINKLDNYSKSYQTKLKQVQVLDKSVGIANNLFNSARADYSEVLFTQREALEAKLELVEIKLKMMNAKVNLYRELGGGWK